MFLYHSCMIVVWLIELYFVTQLFTFSNTYLKIHFSKINWINLNNWHTIRNLESKTTPTIQWFSAKRRKWCCIIFLSCYIISIKKAKSGWFFFKKKISSQNHGKKKCDSPVGNVVQTTKHRSVKTLNAFPGCASPPPPPPTPTRAQGTAGTRFLGPSNLGRFRHPTDRPRPPPFRDNVRKNVRLPDGRMLMIRPQLLLRFCAHRSTTRRARLVHRSRFASDNWNLFGTWNYPVVPNVLPASEERDTRVRIHFTKHAIDSTWTSKIYNDVYTWVKLLFLTRSSVCRVWFVRHRERYLLIFFTQ